MDFIRLTRYEQAGVFRQLFTGESALPHLWELRITMPLNHLLLNTDELVEFLDVLLPCLKEIRVFTSEPYIALGPTIQGSLSRQFHVLEKLDLRKCYVDSDLNELILTSCPHLQIFSSTKLQVTLPTTITDDEEPRIGGGSGGVGPLGWVCTQLRALRIDFIKGTPETNRLMFDQICCMKEMSELYLGKESSDLDPASINWREDDTP